MRLTSTQVYTVVVRVYSVVYLTLACFSTVLGLAPGLNYTFWVRSYEGQTLGPETTVRVTTQGKKLLPVESLQVVVTKKGKTAKLSWIEPPYKAQKVE